MAKAKRRKAEPTARLSEQMKEFLLWVYSYDWRKSGEPDLPGVLKVLISASASVPVSTRVENRLVPWQPRSFIGEHPTPSKTVALSTTLKRLEDRGLLNRYSVKDRKGGPSHERILVSGKPLQTTHVQLTNAGVLAAKSLIQDDDLRKREADNERRALEEQLEALQFALNLLDRERLREHVKTNPESSLLGFLEEAEKRLEHLSARDFSLKMDVALRTIHKAERELRRRLKAE